MSMQTFQQFMVLVLAAAAAATGLAMSISGTVFEDVSFPGGSGRSMVACSGVGRPDVTVEVFAIGGSDDSLLLGTATTDSSGVYSFDTAAHEYLGATGYAIRVVESTVASAGGGTGLVAVSTYRRGETEVLDEVGGAGDITQPDSPESVTNDHLDSIAVAHSVVSVPAGADFGGVDFGFNFSTVVNVNNAGYGSLRQAITNANAMAGAQAIVFMIPGGSAVPGSQRSTNLLTAGVAVILLDSDLPQITDSLTIDASTQTNLMGDTNPGTMTNAGGAVGTDSVAISFKRPEVVIRARTARLGTGLYLFADNITLKGFSIFGFQDIIYGKGGVGFWMEDCMVGVGATASAAPPVASWNAANFPNSTWISGTIRSCMFGYTGGTCFYHYSWGVLNLERCEFVGSSGQIALMQYDNVKESYFHSANGMLWCNNNGGATWENNTFVGHLVYLQFGSGVTFSKNVFTGAGVGIHGANAFKATRNSFYGLDSPAGEYLLNRGADSAPWRTANDSGDSDGIPNFPVLETAKITGAAIEIKGWARPGAVIEFFVSDSGYDGWGCGKTYLGTFTEGSGADTDGTSSTYSGSINGVSQGGDTTNRFAFSFALPGGVSPGTKLCATATTASNSTSEFSGQVTAELEFVPPSFGVVQVVATFSDPANGTTDPKAIPGAVVEYSSTIANSSSGSGDANALRFLGPIPSGSALVVADIGAAGSGPVRFTNGATSSGLTYTFTSLGSATDDVAFSNDGGATWTYTPAPDGNGCDANVTDIRVVPQGTFAGAAGTSPSCTIVYRCQVQ